MVVVLKLAPAETSVASIQSHHTQRCLVEAQLHRQLLQHQLHLSHLQHQLQHQHQDRPTTVLHLAWMTRKVMISWTLMAQCWERSAQPNAAVDAQVTPQVALHLLHASWRIRTLASSTVALSVDSSEGIAQVAPPAAVSSMVSASGLPLVRTAPRS